MNKKIAVVSSTAASVLKKVYETTTRERFNIDLLISDRNCGALEFANSNGIDSFLIESKSNIDFSNRLLCVLEERCIDYVYLFFTRKLVGDIVDKFYRRIINFHPSLLPACPGLHGFDDSIKSGSLLVGSTVHYVNHEIDAGEQIIQTFTPTISVDIQNLRHIIFAQQCASLYFIHSLINSEGLENFGLSNKTSLSQGFIPNLDVESLFLYDELIRLR